MDSENNTFILKLVLSVLGVILVVHLLGIWWTSKYFTKNPNDELLQSIDSLKIKIDALENYRTDLQSIVDTTKVKIVEVEKRYETVRDRIITQSVDSDCITFSNYLSNYKGFFGNNNSSTVEGN